MTEAKMMDDARERSKAAESRLKEIDYAGAMSEAQKCIELSVKALLNKLNINFKKGKIIPHDVSDKIPEAFEELKQFLENYEVDLTRVELAKAAVLLRFLTSIRGYLEYGVDGIAGSKETFDSYFGERLAKIVVEEVRGSHWRIFNLISKIEKQ